VYTLSTLLLAAVFALIVGLATGTLLSRRLSSDGRKQRELERSLDQLLQQQKDYQHEVVEHFTDSAKLLGKLAESYRDVHNHLANGANNLCDDQTGELLQRIPDNSATQVGTGGSLESAQPPLDYAPKVSPHATGVLNEEFGLDKKPAKADDFEVIADSPLPKQA
jgi:uncharacterized membrane-anchored protein YhcB (DUF1043 family)